MILARRMKDSVPTFRELSTFDLIFILFKSDQERDYMEVIMFVIVVIDKNQSNPLQRVKCSYCPTLECLRLTTRSHTMRLFPPIWTQNV